MAGRTVQTTGGGLINRDALGYEEWQTGRAVTTAATTRHDTAIFFTIPMTECFFGSGGVAMIIAVGIGQINRGCQGFIQTFDGVIEKLDDIFATMCVTSRIL